MSPVNLALTAQGSVGLLRFLMIKVRMRPLPLLFLGLLILGLSVGTGILTARKSRSFPRHRVRARLLCNVIAVGNPVAERNLQSSGGSVQC